MKLAITAIATAVVIVGLMSWFDKRDAKVRAAAQSYETCIKKQYDVSPSTYYHSMGEYPVCE